MSQSTEPLLLDVWTKVFKNLPQATAKLPRHKTESENAVTLWQRSDRGNVYVFSFFAMDIDNWVIDVPGGQWECILGGIGCHTSNDRWSCETNSETLQWEVDSGTSASSKTRVNWKHKWLNGKLELASLHPMRKKNATVRATEQLVDIFALRSIYPYC